MPEQDPIDALLVEIRRSLSNTLTMLEIVRAMRRNQRDLLTLLRSMRSELSNDIQRALPAFPEEEGERDA
jgi:hypothetical protein